MSLLNNSEQLESRINRAKRKLQKSAMECDDTEDEDEDEVDENFQF